MARHAGEGAAEIAVSKDPALERYQLLYLLLAYFYLIMAIVMIIMAALTPNINIGGTISFVLLGIIVGVAAIVQIVYHTQLVAYACGTCPLPAID